MNYLSAEIRERLIEKGASIVGFADLKDIPESQREGYRYGISIAVALNPFVITGIEDGPTKDYYDEYVRVNKLLDELDKYAVEIIKHHGFGALPKVKKSITTDETVLRTTLPHKTVATRAGIGWIGKCALLVTKEFGSAVRLSSVLTDAELDVGLPIDEGKCGTCNTCKNLCPSSAVLGVNWKVNMDRDNYFDAFKCRDEGRKRSDKLGVEERVCGKCILVCPWTQKYLKLIGGKKI
ncbi:4Fe-4S double cluster binding domain-containing protein [Clostridium peptidivorans]|uniref:4Fe-4S double cluster binding domain-containing protein n=1 Tax=Clostridium peptidivorans TaxID=100174 RepID=UPI000BE26BA5|nr:4Fe-4S double cluster binding domain-containing protein [Clostridium peptidivorans]